MCWVRGVSVRLLAVVVVVATRRRPIAGSLALEILERLHGVARGRLAAQACEWDRLAGLLADAIVALAHAHECGVDLRQPAALVMTLPQLPFDAGVLGRTVLHVTGVVGVLGTADAFADEVALLLELLAEQRELAGVEVFHGEGTLPRARRSGRDCRHGGVAGSIAGMLDAEVHALVTEAAREPGPVLVLTGAGVSAESGIPTFRGAEGYWTVGSRNYHPQELATAAAFAAMPRDVWRWYLHRLAICRRAEPNAAHVALATLERRVGDRFVLVTQNVDGLHLRAGNSPARTLQIHGNIEFMRCARGCSPALTPIPDDVVPASIDAPLSDDAWAQLSCRRCGAPARPHVLWFDEFYDEALMRAQSAIGHARDASLLVVVGTAGATNLPLQIANVVARLGRPIVDVNVDIDPFADLARRSGGAHLRLRASEAVPLLADAVATAFEQV